MLQNSNFSIEQLVTSVNALYNKVSMHGLRRELIEQQVVSIDLPLKIIELPE